METHHAWHVKSDRCPTGCHWHCQQQRCGAAVESSGQQSTAASNLEFTITCGRPCSDSAHQMGRSQCCASFCRTRAQSQHSCPCPHRLLSSTTPRERHPQRKLLDWPLQLHRRQTAEQLRAPMRLDCQNASKNPTKLWHWRSRAILGGWFAAAARRNTKNGQLLQEMPRQQAPVKSALQQSGSNCRG